MVSINTSVEALLLEEKKYTVKGYSFYDDLNPKKLTNEKIAQYLLDRFYICPVCNKIQRGWALYEEKVDGIVLRKFFFTCKHYVTSLVGLQVVDMEYKDMFVIWLRIETSTEIQLIQRSDSILQPFMQYLQQIFTGVPSGATSISLISISGITDVSGSAASGYTTLGGGGGQGNSSVGIIVGTGNAANSLSTYALQTPIANGTAAGQLQYGTTGTNLTTSGSTVTVLVTRSFTNSSGGTITIAEVGTYINNAGAEFTFAFSRDVLATAISLANGASTTIYYNFQLTIS